MIAALLLLQAAGPADPAVAKRDILASRPCAPAQGDEVVVCGRAQQQEQFRLRPVPRRADADAPALPKAETKLSEAVSVAAETEQAGIGGAPSNRGMARMKIRF